ncbi:MAG TPA: capsule assembly Wzi family protein [Steroidobacteraceae bacterium]|nr:capsule assembly Wzi family protein [Steroidobacteraceae bacterium]
MEAVKRARSRAVFVAALLASLPVSRPAMADAGWFESGDLVLRADLLLLNDADVITLPVTQWPLPRAAVIYALKSAKEHYATNSAVHAALTRVRERVEPRERFGFEARASAGEPGLLRGFGDIAREDAELGGGATFADERFSVTARVTAVSSPDDGQEVRADRSEATVQLGNWLLSANTLERFWGPAYDSNLILSNNARPMPTVMVERAEPRAFGAPLLRWLGPWRFNFGLSRMENERVDIDAPLFMAWRVTIMPWHKFELGFSRTAQFCGEGLPCNFDSLIAMLLGNDNPGFDATLENEPGNQMAGFDIRLDSPIGHLPYAIYGQMIGEDESSYMPAKYLEQFGVEAWKPLVNGNLLHGYLEYIDTTCSASRDPPRFNCAYNQGKFNVEGYRYYGRVIGHTADRDAEGFTAGGTLTQMDGTLWTLTARVLRLNRDGGIDPNNTVAQIATDFVSLEAGWRGQLFGGAFSADLGVQSRETEAGRDVEPIGNVSWTYAFDR